MMGSYANIICTKNSSLTFTDCTIQSSGLNVWNTITVDDVNSLITVYNQNNTYIISDAITAITSENGGQISIENAHFKSCLNGIEIKSFTGLHSAYIAKCHFDGSQLMTKNPYVGNPCENGVYIQNVVNTNNSYSVTIGSLNGEKTNIFEGLINGVLSELSDFRAINNEFLDNRDGINALNFQNPIMKNNYIGIGGTQPISTNTFNRNYSGIEFMGNVNSDIIANSFNDNIDYSIAAMQNKTNGSFNVLNNRFENPNNYNSMAIYIDDIEKDVFIQDNMINQQSGTFCNVGITVHGNNILHIDNNTIAHVNDGIDAIASPLTINQNIINDCDRGIQASGGNGVVFDNEVYRFTSYGIYYGTSNLSINNNIIDNSYFGTNTPTGTGIKSKGSSNTTIEQNEITNSVTGINVIDYANIITIKNNNILDCDAGIITDNFCSNISIKYNNILFKGYRGVYSNNTENCSIKYNSITYNGALTFKDGIYINTCSGSNEVYDNTINMGGSSANNANSCVAIRLINSPKTDIQKNYITNTGLGIVFSDDNSNGIIGCNVIDGAFVGYQLYLALWGELVLSNPFIHNFYIGLPNNPYNNSWFNINASKRVDGSVYTSSTTNYQFDFYYANTNYEYLLSALYYNVTGNFQSYLTSDANFCNIPPIPPAASPTTLVNTSAKQNYRDKYISFAIDTLYNTNIKGPNTNPQGIYNDNVRYNIVKNAYYQYLSMASIQNLGLPSDSIFNSFKQSIDATNIGIKYKINQALKQKNYKYASSLLQSYQPKVLHEFNTFQVYSIFINYLVNDSLSSQDSIALNSIAQQNSYVGGQDVLLARDLLGLFIFDPYIPSNSVARKNTATEEINNTEELSVKVFPNPAKDQLYISRSIAGEQISYYSVYSIEGKLVLQGELQNKSNTTLDISKLRAGLYYIHIIENGNTLLRRKIIKQ